MITLYEMSKEWQNVFEMLLDPAIPEEAVFVYRSGKPLSTIVKRR